MYAVIETGGKQYRVQPKEIVRIEKLDLEDGQVVDFDQVLALHDGKELKVGQPTVAGATVKGTVMRTAKAPKVIIFKYRRRKDYHTKRGHRQWQTVVRIDEISA